MHNRVITHLLLIGFFILLFIPLYLALVAASLDANAIMQGSLPYSLGLSLWQNVKTVLLQGIGQGAAEPVWRMLLNSLIMASMIALGKIILAFS